MLVNLKEILEIAEQDKSAIGMFNATGFDSLQAVIGAAEELNKPVIIAGDFNAEPNEESITRLSDDICFASSPTKFTYPADKPEIEIDYIGIYNKNESKHKVIEAYVVDAPIESDHRPLVSELKFKKQ